MSAVNKPNRNFYDKQMTHTPYKEVLPGNMISLYDKFMTPNGLTNKKTINYE